MPRLVIESGPKKGQEYIFSEKDKVVIGRSSKNFVTIEDVLISRRHCIVYFVDGRWVAEDLGSRNGILVNGSKKKKVVIKYGDNLQVGHSKMQFDKTPDGKLAGKMIAGYQFLEKIGQGGMGEVYRAHQKSLNRTVAIKVLIRKSRKDAIDEKAIQGFIDEARKAGSLNHPNIIQVHDVGQTPEGLVYFSMEYVNGHSLKKWIKDFYQSEDPFPLQNLCEIFVKTAEALQYAHVMGLIHRDIKPDNIMLTDKGEVKVADLGIALKMEDESNADEASKATSIIGTPHYMAPEQILQRPADGRLDIYALGATAYHVFSGYTAFNGKTAKEVIKAHIRVAPTPLTELNDDVPVEVNEIIMKMLEKKPSNRYQQAKEVADAFRKIADNAKSKSKKSSILGWFKNKD